MIETITIQFKDKTLKTLSLEEAKALHGHLEELFGKPHYYHPLVVPAYDCCPPDSPITPYLNLPSGGEYNWSVTEN